MFKWTTTSFVNGTYADGSESYKKFDDAIRLNHGIVLKKDVVTSVTKAKWVLPKKDTLEIDLSKASLTPGHYRLYVYIRSVDNADPLYANDFVYKGRPLNLEFMVKSGQNTSAIAETIVKAAKKWITLLYENGDILKFDSSTSKVTISAVTEFQRLHLCEIQKYNPEALVWAHDGAFETILSTDKDSDEYNDQVFAYTQGRTGFGTYAQLIKDLRLPTNANLRLYADQRDEIPVINGKYWQYVFTQCVERPEMQGTSVLGQYNKSITTHVVFVEDGAQAQFDADVTAAIKAATLIPENNAAASQPEGASIEDEPVGE